MLRENSSKLALEHNQASIPSEVMSNEVTGADLLQELNRLEEMILNSPHVPLTRRTLIDEEQLLDQLDLVRLHLPTILQEAQALVQQKQEIILKAELNSQEIIQTAKAIAAQILNETNIVQQAEIAAEQIREQVKQESELSQEQSRIEIERMQAQAQEQLDAMRQSAIAEAKEIQQGADEYADNVLKNIEQQLNDMLRIIRNGRQQLQLETPPLSSEE